VILFFNSTSFSFSSLLPQIDPVVIKKAGFEEVLREKENHLVVIARPAQQGCGPVIADGAFTKLFYKWQDNGSDRFVRNIVCWLSAVNEENDPNEKPEVIVLDEKGRQDPRDLVLKFREENTAFLFTEISNKTDTMLKEFRSKYDSKTETNKKIIAIPLQKFEGKETLTTAEEKVHVCFGLC